MIFNEVYGTYYNVVAAILTEAVQGDLSKARIGQIIHEKGYKDSILFLEKKLEEKEWPLIMNDYSTPILHVPVMPLTELQKQWMKAICQDPRIRLFDPPLEELDGVEPLFDQDFFVRFDQYTDGDHYTDSLYQQHFHQVLRALREGLTLKICFRGRHNRYNQHFIPEKLEYSPKDDKFRLIAHSIKGTPYVIMMANIEEVSPSNKKGEEDILHEFEKKEVLLELVDKRNALERAMIHFSDLEKQTLKTDDSHYRIKLTYRKDDEKEIIIRLLAFGPMIKVTGPEHFTELIKERLQMQKRFNHPHH